MSNNDSLNDSDELFSIYSSKKVTDTFKAQLKKIAAQNNYSKKAVTDVNNGSTNRQKIKNTDIEVVKIDNDLCSDVINDRERSPSIEAITIDENDSVEFLNVSSGSLRRSERIRKKQSPIACRRETRQPNAKKPKLKKKQSRKKIPNEITVEDSPVELEPEEELNPELSVKVIWKSVKIKKFQIRKFQKLSCIYELLSKEENIPEDKIILMFNNTKVNRNDTPDSLNLQVYHFLDGGVLSEISNPIIESENCINDGNLITIKFQDVNKKVIKLCLQKSDKLKVGMIKCAEQLEIPLDKIKFYFDGELVKGSETPDSLDLENDEIIDIKIS